MAPRVVGAPGQIVTSAVAATAVPVITGENADIDHPIALQTDHPKLLFFQRV